MFKTTFQKSALALVALCGLSFGAAPLEKTGPCPVSSATPMRTNFYNGIDLRSYNNGASLTHNFTTPTSGGNWRSQPPAALKNAGLIQEPLTPEQTVNCVITPPGLKHQLVGSELTPGPVGAKGLAYPLFFNFDERGRMWVIDAIDYPYTHDTAGLPAGAGVSLSGGLPTNRLAGKSRILIYEDTDGDGSLDKFKIFYEGFVLANSLEFVKDGIIVMVPPNVYYVPKSTTNPDTAGGAPTIVVQSLGSADAGYDSHGQPNSLARGLDNWIYGHTGYNGCGGSNSSIANATNATRSGNCGNGNSYRFKHPLLGADTARFEVRSGGLANAHGLGFMEDGQLFKSAATGSSHNQHDVRPGTTALDIRFSPSTGRRDRTRLYTLTNDRYYWEGNNDTITPGPDGVSYYSTEISAVSGSDFYTARLLPEKYWGRRQFSCEGMSGLCNQDSLTVYGASWLSNRLIPGSGATGGRWPNIFASYDAWSAPLKVRTGPDGALYVIDFYNYLFLHNPAGPATNNAYRFPLRYKTRARIYRILPEDGKTQPVLDLTNATTEQLVRTLYHSNMVWRMHAQRLLVEKGYNAELGNLLDTVMNRRRVVDAVELDAPVVHAIWTLHGLKQFEENPTRWNPVLKKLLLHPAWTVRRNVLLAMPATEASYASIREQCAVNDDHAHVRLQALEKLAATPVSGAVIESVEGMRIDSLTPSPTDSAHFRMNYLRDAFTAAGVSKVVSIAGTARPSSCPALLPVVNVKGLPGAAASLKLSQDVRFEARAGGFDLIRNAELPTGALIVYDMRGKVAFRSVWTQGTQSWSVAQARNLKQPVYFYSFRGESGQNYKGRIALSAGF